MGRLGKQVAWKWVKMEWNEIWKGWDLLCTTPPNALATMHLFDAKEWNTGLCSVTASVMIAWMFIEPELGFFC